MCMGQVYGYPVGILGGIIKSAQESANDIMKSLQRLEILLH